MSSIHKDSDSFQDQDSKSELEAHLGVVTVEAAEKVYGKYSKWFLFIGLGLASYIYSLDGSTTINYLAFAASSFSKHSLLASIQVAQAVIPACGNPVVAKIADVSSRATAYVVVLLLYVVGYIIVASSHNIETLGGGLVIYSCGSYGLLLLTSIITADITTLKWRGLLSGLTGAPFIINGFIGANVSASVLEHAGWRWGYGMFAILVPASLSPLIVTLYWAENKAKKLGLVKAPSSSDPRRTITQIVWNYAEQLDVVGLLLLCAAIALILIPLTLSQTVNGGWNNPSIIAMLVVGCVLCLVFGVWDFRFAKRPVVALRFLKNRAVVASSWAGFFDFVSGSLTTTYLYSFVLVVKPWSLINTNYFASCANVSLCVFGICGGIYMRFAHRYKWLLVVSHVIRLAGVGMMIHSRGANGSDVELVFTQIIQGLGGGIAVAALMVGVQASVPHSDVAIITAISALWSEIGGAVGTAIAGAIWTNTMPKNLAKYVGFLPEDQRAELFGSITDVMMYPRGDPIREGVITAYSETMLVLVVTGTAIAVLPVICSLFMPDYYLGDTQNAVDDVGLAGERVSTAPVSQTESP
ncbi:hypothetical protein EIP91_005375 [Steccherinum ochraceum]|uniref:Major facilitator superfamily (MFS) profile domain-containing protein n=1 Tax=Steccherinum ochraceum TaxID=92696 RepID=A0A4R0R9S9_9APHY|nr:hypothetical protein EIP91_005375 [Steccherinum ochraceum]